MPLPKRDWQSPNTYWGPPELDENNLPVFKVETTPIGKQKSFTPPAQTFQGTIWDTPYNRLVGQARPVWDEENIAAEVQPFMGKLTSGIVSRGLSVIPKTGEQLGHIGGAIAWGVESIIDPQNADPNIIWDNTVVRAMNNMDQGLRESLPIYKTYEGRHGGILQQMADPGFWFDDMFDSLAFMGSAYLTGAGAGAAIKGLAFSKALLNTAEGVNAFRRARQYTSTVLNAVGEAGFESRDFFQQQTDKYALQEFGKPFITLDPNQKEQIKAKVAPGASNVFRSNVGILLIPDYIQSRFMFSQAGKAANELRDAVRSGKITSESIAAWKEALKGAGESIISEGPWEEGVQQALQTYNARKENFNQSFGDYSLSIANEWVNNLETTDAQKNMILGSIMGSLFGTFGGRRNALQEREAVKSEEDLYKQLQFQMDAYDKWYIDHVTQPFKTYDKTVKETQDDGSVVERKVKSFYDDKGNTQFDVDKLHRMFLYTLNNKFLFDEAMAATINGDNIHQQVVNNDALARRYFFYATDENMTNLDEVHKLLLERDLKMPEELKAKGYTGQITEADLQPLRQAFENARSQLMDKEDFGDSQSLNRFKTIARKTLFAEEVKRNLYQDLLTDPKLDNKQREDINKLIKDSQQYTDMILNKKTREKLYNNFLQEEKLQQDALTRYQQLQNDPNAKPQDIERAEYELREYQYINGIKEPFSTSFPQQVVEGAKTANEFGTRFNYFLNLGQSLFRKAAVNQAIDNVAKDKAQLTDVVNSVVEDTQNGTNYTKDDLNKINDALENRRISLERAQNQVNQRKESILNNQPEIMETSDQGIPTGQYITNPNYNQHQAELDQNWLDRYENRTRDYQRARQTYDQFITQQPKLTDQKEMRNQQKAYRHFQREYADTPVEKANDMMLSYQGNPDVFGQGNEANEVDHTIAELQRNKRIYDQPGRKRLLTTNQFKGYIESLDKAISDLQSIREKAYKNMESRKAIDKQSRISHSISLFRAIGITADPVNKKFSIHNQVLFDAIGSIIGKDVLNNILKQAKTASEEDIDYSFDSIFVDQILLKVKKDKEGIKKILRILKKDRSTALQEFINAYQQIPNIKNNKGINIFIDLDPYKKNPFRVFDELIDKAVERYKYPIETISSIDKFLRDKDAFALYNAIKSGAEIGYSTISKKELLPLLEAHIKLLSISRLEDKLNSKVSSADLNAAESEAFRDKKIAPSNQQQIALREAAEEISRSLVNKKTMFSGWSYLKGLAGCLSGEVKLSFNRGKRSSGRIYTVEYAYKRFNGIKLNIGSRNWDRTKPTNTLSLLDNYIGYNQIEDILYSGKQQTYKVTTESGRSICVTIKHPFKVPKNTNGNINGFKSLSELKIGDKIILRDKTKGKGRDLTKRPKRNIIYGILYHPNKQSKIVNGKNYGRLPLSKLVIEAELNSVSIFKYISDLKTNPDSINKYKFINPKLEIHHKDNNPLNDERENLMILTKKEHSKIHGKDNILNMRYSTTVEERIISIEKYKYEDTYDIIMNSPHRNYVANDFIVHNTGKTRLIIHYLPDLLKIEPEGIIALSTHENALDVLKSTLDGIPNINMFDQVTQEQLNDEKSKVVIVDEIARLNQEQLNTLAEMVAKANEGRKDPLRVFVLGDPSQVISKESEFPDINNYLFDMINIHDMTPLTSVFRSGNSSIIRAQNVFLNFPGKVKSFLGISSADIGEASDGVHVSNIQQALIRQLDIHKKANSRSRVIVVSNNRLRQQYEKAGVPVMMYYEVAGLEFDEVYTDIDPKDFELTRKFNEAMYTALSRSKSYIFVRSYESSDAWKSRTDKIEKEDNKQRDQDIMTEYTQRLSFERRVLADEMKDVVFSSPQVIRPVIEDQEETTEPQTDLGPGEQEVQSEANVPQPEGTFEENIGDESTGIHELAYPSYQPIKPRTESYSDKQPFVRKGSRVKYIKVYNANQKRYEVHVVAQQINIDGTPLAGNVWETIGVMSEKEMLTTKFGRFLIQQMRKAKKGSQDISNSLSLGNKGTLKFNDGPSILAEGVIHNSAPLSYRYADDIQSQGIGFLSSLMHRLQGIFSEPSKEKLEYKIQIFGKNEENFIPGIPYFIVYRTTIKDEKERSAESQFVRLTARKMKNTDDMMHQIAEFRNVVQELDDMGIGKFGDENINRLIRRFKNNYTLKDEEIVSKKIRSYTYRGYLAEQKERGFPQLTEQQFNKFSEISDRLIPAFYGPGSSRIEVKNEDEMWDVLGESEKTNPDVTYEFIQHPNSFDGYILKRSKRDPDSAEFVTIPDLEAGKGKIQIRLNIIAKANGKAVSDKKISWAVRQRVSRFVKGKRQITYVTKAKSLFTDKTTYGQYYQHLLDLYKKVQEEAPELPGYSKFIEKESHRLTDEENIKRIEEILLQLKEKGAETEGISRKDFDEMRNEYASRPITLNDLNDILTFDENGDHPTFLYPLKLSFINNLGENIQKNLGKLEDLLGTNLQDISKTRIQVKVDNKYIQEKVPKKKTGKGAKIEEKAKDVWDVINKIRKDRDQRTMRQDNTNLGKSLTHLEARQLLQRFLPSINKEGKDVLRFVNHMILKELAGEKVYGLYRNESIYVLDKEGKTFENIIRHEAFHKIFNEFLSPKEQNLLVQAYKKLHPESKNQPFTEIEEQIAIEFQNYQSKKLTKINEVLRRFYNFLARVFHFVNYNTNILDRFFNTIESGYFVTTKNSGLGVQRSMKEILQRYGNSNKDIHQALDVYRKARAYIQGLFFNLYNNGWTQQNDFPVTHREVKSIALTQLQEQLGLIQDHFENNKDLLTEDQQMELAREINYLQKARDNYDRILEDIYPNWDFDAPGEIIVDDGLSTEEIEELYSEEPETESVNISEHIIESDEVDQEKKMTRLVKDFLSNIKLGNRFMNWREAYIRTLQLFEGLQIYNDQFIKQLEEKWRSMGRNPRSEVLVNYLKELYNDAHRINYGKDGADISSNIKFIDEDTLIIDGDNIDQINGRISAEVQNAQIVKRNGNEETREFIIRAAKRNNLDVDDVKGHFIKYQRVDQLKAIINLFNNQKQKNIFIVEKKWKHKGTYSISYIPGDYQGPHHSIASQLSDNLRSKFETKQQLDSWISKWLRPNLIKYKKNPYEFVREFLHEVSMGNLATTIPDINSASLYNDIEYFFTRDAAILGDERKSSNITEDEDSPDIETSTVSMGDVLNNNRKMVVNLARTMGLSSVYIRATNVRDAANKRKYLWSPATFAHNVFFNIIHNRILKNGNMSLSLPEWMNTDYFKHNIFLNGFSRVHEFIDNDGIRNVDHNENTRGIKFTRENTQDYLVRTIMAGFIDRLRYSKQGKPTYFHFFYPTDRNAATGAEVNVLSPEQLRDAIRTAINQINTSPQIKGIIENNKGRFVNFRILEEVLGKRNIIDKPLKEKEIDSIINKILDKFEQEAKRLAERIIENRVQFDQHIFNNEELKKVTGTDLSEFRNAKFYNKDATQTLSDTDYKIPLEAIIPITRSYIANYYVNSYFLNQLILGDNNQFKNEEEVMKRFKLAFSPGFKPIINKVFGMPDKSRFLVIRDNIKNTDDIIAKLEPLLLTPEEKTWLPELKEKFKDNFASGDGQGFMLPERFEQLQNTGFNSEFSIHKIVKPIVFSIDENGVTRAIKYSSIVLTDELVNSFPSLGKLRDNMRRNEVMEAVFESAVKVGLPEEMASHEDILKDNYQASPTMMFDIPNDYYRIQLDPKASIYSKVTQPSQLVYLAGVLQNNIAKAAKIYNHLATLSRAGADEFFSRFGNAIQVRRNIREAINPNGNEKLDEILAAGLSINFPSIANSIITQLASHLQKNIVKFSFSGTKLVLQSEYGVRKYHKTILDGFENKLRYIRTSQGRLVAEVVIPRGLLPEEHEKRIEAAIAAEKEIPDYFMLPDLVGWRIPSSDIHSGIAMKVVGFYDTPNLNVIIAPDILVALHGSDFDIDSLFVVKREVDKDNNLIGYKRTNNGYTFDDKLENTYTDNKDIIKFHKNGIVDGLLDIISSKENVKNMLSPIPLRGIEDERDRVKRLRPAKRHLDLSNFNDVIDSHNVIHGASAARGILVNGTKALAYSLRTGIDGENPTLRNDEDAAIINGKVYDRIQEFDDTGENIFTSIDGFINAAIDNMKLLALNVLNIQQSSQYNPWNSGTINGFIALRALGVPLETVDNILQQPALLDLTRMQSIWAVKNLIEEKLGPLTNIDLSKYDITDDSLIKGIHAGESIRDIKPAVKDGKIIDQKSYDILATQYVILNMFDRMNRLGNSLGLLAQWLKIARTIPTSRNDIEKIFTRAKQIFGEDIDLKGNLPLFEESSFPFDISNFFKKSPHILEVYKNLQHFRDLISETFKKYSPSFEQIIDHVYQTIGNFTMQEVDARDLIRDELLTYLMSNEIYSGEYQMNRNVQFKYKVKGEERVLTGLKAVNQIFIGKVIALKNYMVKHKDAQGNPIQNMFLNHLYSIFNPVTGTYELRYDNGTNRDHMDLLDMKASFYELNKYHVTYNNKTGEYFVRLNNEPRADNEYTDFQKEFVSYGIMNWGLRFGLSNYSLVLPEDLYIPVDNLYNNLLDRFTGENAEDNWKKIADDFMIQFVVNNGNRLKNIYRSGKTPIIRGKTVNQYGKQVNFYSGEANSFFYDRSYDNSDGKEMPKFIVEQYQNDRTIYIRMNDPMSQVVYYQVLDRVAPFKYYLTSDEVLQNGYNLDTHFKVDPIYDRPIRNIRVAELNQKEFQYNGNDLKESDIVTFTQYHDITRVNKSYKQIVKQFGTSYVVKDINAQTIEKKNLEVKPHDIIRDKEVHRILQNFSHELLRIFPGSNEFKLDTRSNMIFKKMSLEDYNKVMTDAVRINKEDFNEERIVVPTIDTKDSDQGRVYINTMGLLKWFLANDISKTTAILNKYNIIQNDASYLHSAKASANVDLSDDFGFEHALRLLKQEYTEKETISDVIDSMIDRNKDNILGKTLRKFKKIIIQQNIKLAFNPIYGIHKLGDYSNDGTIRIDLMNISLYHGVINTENVDPVIVHEMLHGITTNSLIENPEFRNKLTSILSEYFTIDDITGQLTPLERYQKIIEDQLGKEVYGFKNVDEFVSELYSNDKFANTIHKLSKPEERKSLLRRIVDYILQFFGLKEVNKTLDIEKELTDLIKSTTPVKNFIRVGKNIYRSSSGQNYIINSAPLEVAPEEKVIDETDQDEVKKKIMDLANQIKKESSRATIDIDEKGEQKSTYSIEGSNKKIKRTTERHSGFLSFFTGRKLDPELSFGEIMANRKWQSQEHDHKLLTDRGQLETWDEYKNRMNEYMRQGQIKGEIMHKQFMRKANQFYKLGYDDKELLKQINDLASFTEGKITPDTYSWMENRDILKKIFYFANINMFSDIPESLRDIIYLPEQTVWDDKIGFGGTIDALIGHADGRWSIKDWKTGRRFGSRTTTEPMRYGLQTIYVTDNQRERAKLQVMFYAFLLKLKHPEMQFRDLMTVWIPDEFLASHEDMERYVEVEAYLNMIKQFFSDRKALKEAGIDPDIISYILEKSPKIFDVGEYTNKATNGIMDEITDSNFKPEQEYRKRIAEIQAILNKFKGNRQIRIEELPEYDQKRLERLYEQVAILSADPSLDLNVFPQQEIGKLTEWLGNYSDISMGIFQPWIKLRNERYNAYTLKHERDLRVMSNLFNPIYDQYMKGKLRVRRGGVDRIANVNYAELFHFAFKQEERDGYSRERLVLPKDDEWKDLTKEQQTFLTHANNMFKSWFVGPDAYFNQKATTISNRDYTWLDLHNFDRAAENQMKWYEGWFPKVMKTNEEINYEEGTKILNKQIGEGDVLGANILGRFSRKNIKEKIRRNYTWFIEDTFENFNDVKMSIPIKFLDNFTVMNQENYTHNMIFMFDYFNKSALHKKYMDDVYSTGQALATYLKLKKYGNGQPMFDNTRGFLEKKLISDVQNKLKRTKISRQPITLGKYWDPIDKQYRTFNVSIDQVIQRLIGWSSATIMWLKPTPGLGNGIFAKSLTWREAVKGSIAEKFLHIDGNLVDLTIKDNVWADKEYFSSFLKDSMFGDLNKNKMWLMARELNYIPDNFDYATNRRFLLSTRNTITDRSTMYMFYGKPEEYVSLTTMAAQLHHLKNPNTGKSLWDSYEVQQDDQGVYNLVWTGGIRGYEKVGQGTAVHYEPINELTAHEIEKLKKVHERMQGGYRKEEAANLEIYVLGKAFMQFKRYFPRLIMNALGSKREEVALGYYKKLDETRIDPKTGEKIPTYEWIRRINEGRWRTIIGLMLSWNKNSSGNYKWSSLSSEQKQNIVDCMLTTGMLMMSYAAYLLLFYDQDDDDTFKKWWFNYLVMNMSQQYNPLDMLQTLETAARPVAFARMLKMTQATFNMLVATGNLLIGSDPDASFQQDGHLKGWNEFMRSVPYLASFHDFANKMQHGSFTQEWWVDKWANHWR